MKDILFLPVKPKWAELIINGHKNLELRKRRPSNGCGNPCVIYASSPWSKVIGVCNFTQIYTISSDKYTLTIYDRAHVTSAEFREYANVADRVYGLELLAPRKFANAVSLEVVRQRWRIDPPQQWRYIDRQTFDEIVQAGQ